MVFWSNDMNYWESFKRKVFGEPLSDEELKELNDTVFNVSAKEKEKLVKESKERFQKNYLKYSIGWTLIYLGAWGFLIWKGLRNGETIYEIMTKEDVLMFYVFGVMLIGFVFFRMKNIKYEDGMS